MKLYELASGDQVYHYEKSIVAFFKGKRKVLSTSVYNGGYHEDYEAVYNHDSKVGAGMACEMLAPTYTEHMTIISNRLGLNPSKVSGMGTAADMENVCIESLAWENLTVTAIVTGGIEINGGRVGDPATWFKPMEKPNRPGTINIMLFIDADLPAGTVARALVTCTEAKTAAIQELQEGSKYSTGIATGSGTDTTIVVANADSDLYLEGAGKHSKLGELIGKVVTKAVKGALSKQSNLNPQRQHDIFRRLKRFGVNQQTIWALYQKEEKCAIKPVFLETCEAIAKEKPILTYTALYAHLLDEYQWKLIDEEEVLLAGNKLLTEIANIYGVAAVEITSAGVESLMEAYSKLYVEIVKKKLMV